MNEWNKSLAHQLTDLGLAKILKAGFSTPDDVTTLIGEESIDDLDLSVRDKAVLRKIIGG